MLPIPPGIHWSEAKPRVLPEVSGLIEEAGKERKAIEQASRKQKRQASKAKQAEKQAKAEAAAARASTVAAGALHFESGGGDQGSGTGGKAGDRREGTEGTKQKSPAQGSQLKPQRSRPKNDPRLVAAARELRDRWLEQAAAEPRLIGPGPEAKYDVSRAIESAPSVLDAVSEPMRQITAREGGGESQQAA